MPIIQLLVIVLWGRVRLNEMRKTLQKWSTAVVILVITFLFTILIKKKGSSRLQCMNSVITLLTMDNADVGFSMMHSVVRLSESSLYMSKVLRVTVTKRDPKYPFIQLGIY